MSMMRGTDLLACAFSSARPSGAGTSCSSQLLMNENAVMSRTISPRLLVETVEGITIASFTDEMLTSEEVIWEVDGQLMSLVDGPSPEKLLLNFREVRMMSSTMLAILLKLAEDSRRPWRAEALRPQRRPPGNLPDQPVRSALRDPRPGMDRPRRLLTRHRPLPVRTIRRQPSNRV